MFVEDPT
jgi:hypothetical protein